MGSWGRHGWPRKDEGLRLYRDKDDSYFVLDPEAWANGAWDAIGNVMKGPNPTLGSCRVSPQYLLSGRIKRVQWDELPAEWQQAIRPWLGEDAQPEDIRGFWLIGRQPKQKTR